ncbi:MAG: ABC transporter ATP-binding protein [Acidimicrobiales bacterium]
MAEAILEVSDLYVDYVSGAGTARAVDDVNIALAPGEFLAIVGESGCGKSTLLFAIAQLLSSPAELTGGSVIFKGKNLVQLTERDLKSLRWTEFSVVMQSAMNALNPMKSVGAQFTDAMRAHGVTEKAKIADRSREVLALVGIDAIHLKSYPHQLSGGMRQRVMIAMALLFSPELILMDEPTSALDVVAQRSLMVKVKELQERLGFAVIFVTHDMSLVNTFSDRLAVMYAGMIVELGRTGEMFKDPLHPYTQGLVDAFPSIYGPRLPIEGIPGSPPDLSDPPAGCRFHPRCPKVMSICSEREPELYSVNGEHVRCFLYEVARE